MSRYLVGRAAKVSNRGAYMNFVNQHITNINDYRPKL